MAAATPRCVLLFGGSFDPVHSGHLALAALFMRLLNADVLRLIPAGNPWQKQPLHASAADRIAMLQCAFTPLMQASPVALQIDTQEIERNDASYTIDTVRRIRTELGAASCLVLLLGADQLLQLDSWHQWRSLFDYVHLGIAARPGFAVADAALPPAVAAELRQRHGSCAQLRASPHGRMHLSTALAHNVSSSAIRNALRAGAATVPGLTDPVLDYIQHHHLYQN